MRHVVSNSEVAHLWANQSQADARNAKDSMSFSGKNLYSYSTRVGVITDAALYSKQIVLLLDYPSHTTARHVSLGWRALDDERYHPIRVDSLLDVDYGDRSHYMNILSKYDAYKKSVARLIKPHVYSYHGDTLLERTRTLYELATPYREYAMAFGLQEPYPNFDAYVSDLREAFKRYYDPKQAGLRAQHNAIGNLQRARSLSRMYAFIEGVLPRPPVGWDKRSTPYELRSSIRSVVQPYVKPHNVTPEQWREGAGGAYQHFDTTLVRRKGNVLETSMGAYVSWPDAVSVYERAQHYRATRCTTPLTQAARIGSYMLDRIAPDGSIKVGCHFITWTEMQRLALREQPEIVRASFPLPVLAQEAV